MKSANRNLLQSRSAERGEVSPGKKPQKAVLVGCVEITVLRAGAVRG